MLVCINTILLFIESIVMGLYVVYHYDSNIDGFPIVAIVDNEETAKSLCTTEDHCYNSIQLELNKDYSSLSVNPEWVYPLRNKTSLSVEASEE